MASFIGYTFTLTFAVSSESCLLSHFLQLHLLFIAYLVVTVHAFQVQGAVNTLGDLRGTFASIERINSILSAKDIDDSLAYGLAKELDSKELEDYNGAVHENGTVNKHYMSALKSCSSCGNLAWSGDIHLEGLFVTINIYLIHAEVLSMLFRCIFYTYYMLPSAIFVFSLYYVSVWSLLFLRLSFMYECLGNLVCVFVISSSYFPQVSPFLCKRQNLREYVFR